MGVRPFLAAAALFVLGGTAFGQTRWAVVLPFQMASDTTGGQITNRMALEFYAGFKAALDSANTDRWPITLDVYDFDEARNAVVDRSNTASPTYLELDAFMADLARKDVRYVVGPFRGQDSERLARHAGSSTYVVNPLSRDINVSGLPQLIAAAPLRYAESEALGKLAAAEARRRPNSRTVLFDLGDKPGLMQRRAFVSAFHAYGGDTSKIQLWDGRPSANLVAQIGKDDYIPTRFVLLDDKVLSAARILQGLRQRPADQTEFWTVSSTVNSPSLDAFLLLRQPVVWVQTDRLEFATYDAVDAHLSAVLGDARSRWAWIGYDTALMLVQNEPEHFVGPRRSYRWSSVSGGGQQNKAVELYRYEPRIGVNSVELPALPK